MTAAIDKQNGATLIRWAAAGVAIGVLFALVAIGWFGARTTERLALEELARAGVIEARAAAAIAGRQIDDPNAAALLASMLADLKSASPLILSAEIIDADERALVASTEESAAAPRSLARGEKALFDRSKLMRAHARSNVIEGAPRQPEILLLRNSASAEEGQNWRIATPIPHPTRVAHIEIMTAPAAPKATAIIRSLGMLWLFGAASAATIALGWRARKAPSLTAIMVAATFLTAALAAIGAQIVSSSASEQQQATFDTAASAFARASSLLANAGLTVNDALPLDSDAYQRQRTGLTAEGAVDQVAAAQSTESLSSVLIGGHAGSILMGALVTWFFAAGGARQLVDTVKTHRSAYIYVGPAIAGMLILVFFPFLYGVVLSFTDTTLLNERAPLSERWVYFDNYAAILGDLGVVKTTPEGPAIDYQNFYWNLIVTLVWTVTNVAVGVSVGLGLALLLNTKDLKFRSVYRVLLILPWAIPSYITALTWKGMFHEQFGVINQAIQLFGFQPVAWFDGLATSFLTGLVANGWLSFPFMMVVSLGALQSINQEMYEAADLEGASAWRKFRDITLPSLQPALLPAIILSVVWTFNMFNVIYLVSGGEPGGANEILLTRAYKIGFEQYQYGYAAAYSMVIFAILFLYGFFQTKATRVMEADR